MDNKNSSGWFVLSRKEDYLYFKEPFTKWQAWQDLIRLACFSPKLSNIRGRVILHEVGKVYESQEGLATRWKWSRGKVIRFLNEIETDGRIVQQKSKVITCISIVNYSEYQLGDTRVDTTPKNVGTSFRTSDDTRNDTKDDTSRSPINTGVERYGSTTDSTDIEQGNGTQSSTTLKENKINKINIHDNTHTHEDESEIDSMEREFIDEMKNNRTWQEQAICMRHKISVDECLRRIDEFHLDCKCQNKHHTSSRDAYQHFANWLKIQKDKERKYEGDKQEGSNRRRGLEVDYSTSQDYKTSF